MKRRLSKKAIKSILIFSVLNPGIQTIFSSSSQAVPQPEISVTKGSINQFTKSLEANEKLSIGKEWAIYDDLSGNYYDNAIVANTYFEKGRCTPSVRSNFRVNNIKTFKKLNNRSLLFLRGLNNPPKSIRIKKVKFSDLPIAAQGDIFRSKGITYRENTKNITNGEYNAIDINGDGNIDIIDSRPGFIAGSQNIIFVNLNSHWVEKYNFTCESGC